MNIEYFHMQVVTTYLYVSNYVLVENIVVHHLNILRYFIVKNISTKRYFTMGDII